MFAVKKHFSKHYFTHPLSLSFAVLLTLTACGGGGSGTTTNLSETAALDKANALLKSAIASDLLPKDCNVALSDKKDKPEQSSEFVVSCGDGTTFAIMVDFSADGKGKEDDTLRQGKDNTLQITLSDSSVFDDPQVQKWAKEMIADASNGQPTVYGCTIDTENSRINCTGKNLEGASVASGGGSSSLQKDGDGKYSGAISKGLDPTKPTPVTLSVTGENGDVSPEVQVATVKAQPFEALTLSSDYLGQQLGSHFNIGDSAFRTYFSDSNNVGNITVVSVSDGLTLGDDYGSYQAFDSKPGVYNSEETITIEVVDKRTGTNSQHTFRVKTANAPVVVVDSDGDGVPDSLDAEPNNPNCQTGAERGCGRGG